MKKNHRALLFLLMGVVLSGAAAWFNLSHLRTLPEQNQQVPQLANVVVAASDVPASETIRAPQVRIVQWPEAIVPPGTFGASDEVSGRVARRRFHEGEPIFETGLFAAGTSAGLAPRIGPKMRAVSVEVDEVIGIAGFVKPGTRVDVVATIKGRGSSLDPYSKVILQDIRVLAVDQTLEEQDGEAAETVNVVTLEVSPADAEKIAFAAHQGALQLALRHPADKEVVVTQSADATALKGRKKAALQPRRRRIEVIEGVEREIKYF